MKCGMENGKKTTGKVREFCRSGKVGTMYKYKVKYHYLT